MVSMAMHDIQRSTGFGRVSAKLNASGVLLSRHARGRVHRPKLCRNIAPAAGPVLIRFTPATRRRNVARQPSRVPLLPLEGFVVGVTADRRWSEQTELLERRGAAVLHGPTISTEYLGSDDALRRATEAVITRPPDYLVATTGIGVRAWFEAAQAWGLAEKLMDALAATRVVARGPKATAAIQIAGLAVWASPASERLDDAVALLAREELTGRVIAFQHYGERDGGAVAAIAARGGGLVEVPVYRYRQPADDTKARRLIDAICTADVDAVTFTSAPSARNLVALASQQGRAGELLAAFNERDVVAACVGPVCAGGARGAGIERPVAPAHGRLGLLVHTLTDVLHARRRVMRCGSVPFVVQGRVIEVAGEPVDLSRRERAVLEVLLRRHGAVVSKTAILHSLGSDPTGGHALETTIARLRRGLGVAGLSIHTVRGRGYRLDAKEPRSAAADS
jgi:uroporphyrinogen-III synthase